MDLTVSEYHLAADATCFRLRAASTHYLPRLGQRIEVRDALKAVDCLGAMTGALLPGRTWWMKNKRRAIEYFAFDL